MDEELGERVDEEGVGRMAGARIRQASLADHVAVVDERLGETEVGRAERRHRLGGALDAL